MRLTFSARRCRCTLITNGTRDLLGRWAARRYCPCRLHASNRRRVGVNLASGAGQGITPAGGEGSDNAMKLLVTGISGTALYIITLLIDELGTTL